MTSLTNFDPAFLVAEELNLPKRSVAAVAELFREGNTIPFIARYRKEATGNLDEVQIRTIQERLNYLSELEERRNAILDSIEKQGKLTDELRQQIQSCTTKSQLEDLYLPYKPKRRTRAQIAKERGLDPLAERILLQPDDASLDEALAYIDAEKGVASIDEAWQGARDIVAEMISERADIRQMVRERFAEEGIIQSRPTKDYIGKSSKFEQYYDFAERAATIPSHRYLAIRRGEKEGVLEFSLIVEEERICSEIRTIVRYKGRSPLASQLEEACQDSFKRLLSPSIETDLRVDLKMRSDEKAVEYFADNLRNLLLASPLGARSVIGIDPGLRTGCKCVAIDSTGKYIDACVLYLTQGDAASRKAKSDLLHFVEKHRPIAIAIGNGTGGRETEAVVKLWMAEAKKHDLIVVQVNEAGASVYSASDIAREEFPDLDLTLRGSISIARRLQDPLAELVKIDPKSIGVGQYQHDVYQQLLHDKLAAVVESCVNHVGVELNTASAPLLSYVAGIGASLAKKIVKYREDHGHFHTRQDLFKVPGMGPKTFQQAGGFLRIHSSPNPLDRSAVHPERYDLVQAIAKDMNIDINQLVGNEKIVKQIPIRQYVSDQVGELTLVDIIQELQKPGRDPRSSFEMPSFRDDVNTLQDLKPGMKLQGIVTNVTAFGAFVDIGVHQDGMVHISQLSDRFIKDAREAVSVGDKIQVEVVEVDLPRKRISLTAKNNSNKAPPAQKSKQPQEKKKFNHNPFGTL